MVRTSNWPPLVAMSVVTRWRRTFSSSVTHFTTMSGFLAVKSLVRPCMRIMSPLLTVAIVSVVSAFEGAEHKSAAAPRRAPRTFFTVTSHDRVFEHMPTRWVYVHTNIPGLSSEGVSASARRQGAVCVEALRKSQRGPRPAASIELMWPQTPPTLLPLWEKVARTKFAPDEGSLSVHSVESVARGGKPLTRSSLGRPADLPSPTRGEGATMRSA